MSEFYVSKFKLLVGLGAALTFGTVGFFVASVAAHSRFDQFVGWFVASAGGGVAIMLATQLFSRGPRLRVSDAGIEDLKHPAGFIPWSNIASASLRGRGTSRQLCLFLRNGDSWFEPYRLQHPWRANLYRSRKSTLILPVWWLAADADDIMGDIRVQSGGLTCQ